MQNAECRMQNEFSVLILLRRLFLLLARHSVQAPSALASCVGSVFPLQAEIEKLKSFPFSAFGFPFISLSLHRSYITTHLKSGVTGFDSR